MSNLIAKHEAASARSQAPQITEEQIKSIVEKQLKDMQIAIDIHLDGKLNKVQELIDQTTKENDEVFATEKAKTAAIKSDCEMDMHKIKMDVDWFKHDTSFRIKTLEEYIKKEAGDFTKIKL